MCDSAEKFFFNILAFNPKYIVIKTNGFIKFKLGTYRLLWIYFIFVVRKKLWVHNIQVSELFITISQRK